MNDLYGWSLDNSDAPEEIVAYAAAELRRMYAEVGPANPDHYVIHLAPLTDDDRVVRCCGKTLLDLPGCDMVSAVSEDITCPHGGQEGRS